MLKYIKKLPLKKRKTFALFSIFFLFLSVLWFRSSRLKNPDIVYAQTPTDANFKVAFIGDSAAGSSFQSVLNLIKNEGAQMVLHQGDFDYSDGPQKWMDMINNTLGSTFPYLGSDGNHDNWDSDGYATFFKDRLVKMGLTPPAGNLPPSYAATYKGLKMVFSKEGGDPTFIGNELVSDSHTWKICSWHKNQNYMQLGSKGNEQGWPDYETCRQYGAIISTGHEHTYERTKTLLSTQNLIVDTNQHPVQGGVPGNPNSLLVAPGKTFVFVSGVGGNGIRNQDRCLPTTYPYGGGVGCNYIWAKAYTSDQGGKYGALFITFNVDGNPNKARGYFKNISGETIDQFEITASSVPVSPPPTTITPTQRPTISPTKTPTPSPTRSPSISPTKTPTPTPTRTGTPTVSPRNTPTTAPTSTSAPTPPNKFRGDADCNGAVNEIDYQIYVSQYKKTPRGCPIDADFNNDGKINAVDYVIWMNTYDTIKPSVTPTPIPSASPSVSPPPGGEVKVEQTVTGKATGNPTSVTSESIDAAAQRLYVASISTKPNRAVSGVSGLGLSWVRSKTQCSGRSQTRTEIWRAYGSPSTSGSVKATFSSSAKPASAVISVTSFSGANPSRLIGAKPSRNTLGVNSTTCTGGTDASSYSFTLNPVSSNSLIYSAVSIRQRTHTPGEGYTELSDFTTDSSSNRVNLDDDDDDDDGSGRSGDAAGIATQYKIINSQSPTIVNGTINHDLDYAAVSIEIIAGQ